MNISQLGKRVLFYHGSDLQHARDGSNVGRIEADVGLNVRSRCDGCCRIGTRKSRISHLILL